MPVDARDADILEKMLRYCDEIEEAHQKCGRSYAAFVQDSVYRNAVSLCLMQIGELSNHLSEDFKARNASIPWREIRGMRNVVAHEYGHTDTEIVWETATEDIAGIRAFCERVLREIG